MSKPLVCVTVTGATTAELRQKRDAVADADLVELRLDSVADPDVGGALEGRRLPVIVTCRPTWEGGGFTGSEERRRRILSDALELGADYVDIEWRARFDDLIERSGGRRIVLSSHDYHGVPADLLARVGAMRATGAQIVKIAVTLNSLRDALTLHDLGAQSGTPSAMILIGMGEYGLATRVLAGRFGSIWTYAGGIGAVGQLTPQTLLQDYHFRSITAATANLRHRRRYGRALGLAGHAQRGVSGRETRCGLPAVSGRERRLTSPPSAAPSASTAPASPFRSRCRCSIRLTK